MPGLSDPTDSLDGCLTRFPAPSSAGVASAIKTVHIKLIGLSTDVTCKSFPFGSSPTHFRHTKCQKKKKKLNPCVSLRRSLRSGRMGLGRMLARPHPGLPALSPLLVRPHGERDVGIQVPPQPSRESRLPAIQRRRHDRHVSQRQNRHGRGQPRERGMHHPHRRWYFEDDRYSHHAGREEWTGRQGRGECDRLAGLSEMRGEKGISFFFFFLIKSEREGKGDWFVGRRG